VYYFGLRIRPHDCCFFLSRRQAAFRRWLLPCRRRWRTRSGGGSFGISTLSPMVNVIGQSEASWTKEIWSRYMLKKSPASRMGSSERQENLNISPSRESRNSAVTALSSPAVDSGCRTEAERGQEEGAPAQAAGGDRRLHRPEPTLSGRRLFFALIYGSFYHPLQLLLIPAWAALVASPQSLYPLASLALIASVLLLTWGNISTRWEQMNVHIERWFLRGAPLIISVLVIVLALLRILQFDYISTILDALPFGTIFGLVVMTYVLFWFVEYWMNRVLAVRLLRVMAADGTENAARILRMFLRLCARLRSTRSSSTDILGLRFMSITSPRLMPHWWLG
jgi:hypothetical protein